MMSRSVEEQDDKEEWLDISDKKETSPLIRNRKPKQQSDRQRGFLARASFYDDDNSELTFSRKLARYLSRFSWYYPQKRTGGEDEEQDIDKGNLDDAWAYFEHFTLGRYYSTVTTTDGSVRAEYSMAEPGEHVNKTKLYPVLTTPEKELADFGIGVGTYFCTLRILCYIMFIAGILSLPNIWYFSSYEYDRTTTFQSALSTYHSFHKMFLVSSAICSNRVWQACPNCTLSDWDYFPVRFDHYAETESTGNGADEIYADNISINKLTFILVNKCGPIPGRMGIVSCCTMLFVGVAIYLSNRYLKNHEVEFGVASETITDYSIVVSNPPKDAKDPTEWKDFFEQFGHVTSLTIAYNNGELMKKLLERRSLLTRLESVGPPPTTAIGKFFSKLSDNSNDLQNQIKEIDKLIEMDLSKRTYEASGIYVVYETPTSQERALQALQVPYMKIFRNDVSCLSNINFAFRQKHVLFAKKAPEPSSVRWHNLHQSIIVKRMQRFITALITVVLIVISCAIVIYVRKKYGAVYAAFAISIIDTGSFYLCSYIVHKYESHGSEGSRQASLYFKNMGFLWVISTVLIFLITPFEETLDDKTDSLIPAMYYIFIAEMFTGVLFQLVDPSDFVYKHVLAPRAPNQRQMRKYFQGTEYNLSERYTNMTKLLFLTLSYAMLFPMGFFLASCTLAIHYWTDKFCLLRVWYRAPKMGNHVAEMNRTYFQTTALILYALITAYCFSSFPYDNACPTSSLVSDEYVGQFQAVTGEGEKVEIEITDRDSNYYFCNQDLSQYWPPVYPPFPHRHPSEAKWMTSEQVGTVYVFSIIGLAFICAVIVVVIRRIVQRIRKLCFISPFEPSKPRTIPLSNFSEIDRCSYIPEVKQLENPFPILFCDIAEIDPILLSWHDQEDPTYQSHNAIFDIPGLKEQNVFSTVHHWPPPFERQASF